MGAPRLARFGLRSRPRVTVVVPVYNVEPYLRECLDSIEAQDVPEGIEVLIIDDGSADGSGALADDWAADRQHVQVVHQANRGPGPGAARNVGLALARGRYIGFLDGDDRYTPGALLRLHSAAEETGADLCIGRMRSFPEPKKYPWDDVFDGLTEPRAVAIEDVRAVIHNPAPGNKLFRTKALRRRRLTFAEGIHHQDTYVSIPMMLHSPEVTLTPEVVQEYRRRPGSIMATHFTRQESFFDHLQVVEHLSELRRELSEARAAVLDTFLARSMQGFVIRGHELAPERAREFFLRAGRVYRDVSPQALAAATRSPQHRRSYAAVVAGDWAAWIAANTSEPTSVWAHAGSLYTSSPSPAPDPLHRTGAVVAKVHAVRVAEARAALSGTVRVHGTAPVHELAVRARVGFRGTEVSVPCEIVADHTSNTSAWTATVALDDLAPGRYEPRLLLETATGPVSTALRWGGDGGEAILPPAVGGHAIDIDPRGTLVLTVSTSGVRA